MIKGTLSGFVTTFCVLPFQVLSTNMKISNMNSKVRVSMIDMIRKIYKKDGIKGFYRGLTPNLIRIPIGDGIFFSVLECSQNAIKKYTTLPKNANYFISSSLGMAAECLLINPVLVVATRYESLQNKHKGNMLQTVLEIKRNEGYKAFYKGIVPLLLKEVPSRAVFYSLFMINLDYLQRTNLLGRIGLKPLNSVLASIISGSIISILDNPFDLVRTRAQCTEDKSKTGNKNLLKDLKEIVKNEGILGLQKGVMPRLIRKVVSASFKFTIYTFLSNRENKI